MNALRSPTQVTRTDQQGAPAPGPRDPSSSGDDELLSGLGAGRLDALDALYERYGSAAYGLARRITADDALAADVVEAAFLEVWRAAATFTPRRATARTWLLTIVHDRAIDEVRRRRAPRDVDRIRALEAVVSREIGDVVFRPDRAKLAAALASLPVEQRSALEMAYFDGLTAPEIATRTGADVDAVQSWLQLALLGLRGELARSGAATRR